MAVTALSTSDFIGYPLLPAAVVVVVNREKLLAALDPHAVAIANQLRGAVRQILGQGKAKLYLDALVNCGRLDLQPSPPTMTDLHGVVVHPDLDINRWTKMKAFQSGTSDADLLIVADDLRRLFTPLHHYHQVGVRLTRQLFHGPARDHLLRPGQPHTPDH